MWAGLPAISSFEAWIATVVTQPRNDNTYTFLFKFIFVLTSERDVVHFFTIHYNLILQENPYRQNQRFCHFPRGKLLIFFLNLYYHSRNNPSVFGFAKSSSLYTREPDLYYKSSVYVRNLRVAYYVRNDNKYSVIQILQKKKLSQMVFQMR